MRLVSYSGSSRNAIVALGEVKTMSEKRQRRFETDERDGLTIIKFIDPLLDEQNSWIIKKQVAELVEESEQGPLLLDFRHVKFLSSAALGALLSLHRKAKKQGVDISLCHLAPELEEVFQASGLDEVFDVRPPS
jgi:anti-sigma B factor antagonist